MYDFQLASRIDSAHLVERGFDRGHHRCEKNTFAGKDTRHEAADRFHACENDQKQEQVLKPAGESHLEVLRAQHCVDEIGQAGHRER
jgi:hypothetical protein